MCGICGILHSNSLDVINGDLLVRMCDAITHRGPDDDGYFVSSQVGLGMRRLSIIDLESGKQPIHNENASIQVVFNGEIYNYRDLKNTLEVKGHVFYTHSDTEVIVHAYEEFGENCFNKLKGMFAIALWDDHQKKLLLAIDRIGIKPLYYANIGNDLFFGSEMKCLTTTGKISRELDYEALSQYFKFGYIAAPLSIFRDVKKLLPGHYLSWKPGNELTVQAYWDFPGDTVRFDRSPIQTRHELLEVLKDAVRSQLVSDVPLGAFLSGGIDSSTVVALMSQVVSEPIKTFSIGFVDRAYNELDKARLVAKLFKTDHHEMMVEPETIDILPALISHFGEPFADSSALPTYFVSKMAREHVKVALSGDGGDELFLGYTINRGLELAHYLQVIPAPARKSISNLIESLPAINTSWASRVNIWKKRGMDSLLSPRDAYKSKNVISGFNTTYPFLSMQVQQALIKSDPYSIVDTYLDNYPASSKTHPLDQFVYAGLKYSLPNDMLVKVDRMSMANSLEVRVPLLDDTLVEYVSTIPVTQRFPYWRLKGLLRDTMSKLLPPSILNKSKKGFSIPLAAWFHGDILGFARDVLLSPSARQRGYLDNRAVGNLLSQQSLETPNASSSLWALLMFELWCLQDLT